MPMHNYFLKEDTIMKYLQQSVLLTLLISTTSYADVIDFSTDMTLRDDAYINESHVPNGVVLTDNSNGEKGSAFTNTSFSNINSFTAEFDIKIGWGSEADGMTFGWVSDPSANTDGGGYLGFSGLDGYAIEFDTYDNGSWDSGDSNHIALIQDTPANPLTQTNISAFNLSDETYRHVLVDFDSGVISVDIDGTNYINDYTIAGYTPFDGYFGFTASTGGLNDYHKVANFNLTVSAVPEPSTYALMLGGLGLVGFMAARRRKTA